MKKILFLVTLISLMSFNFAKAQSSLIATLSHDDNVKVFYGTDALKQAHEAATSGDVITLSSGSFNATTITKAITLRGAGVINDSENGIESTRINSSITIQSANDTINRINIEGIIFEGTTYSNSNTCDIIFKNCRLREISDNNSHKNNNIFLVNCRVTDHIRLSYATQISCLNSIIRYVSGQNFCFKNCILQLSTSPRNSSFENSIFVQNYSNRNFYLEHESIVKNCISSYSNTFNKITNNTNKTYDITKLFKTFSDIDHFSSSTSELFELTEEARTTYLGTDGKEVGIHGGDFPFDETSDFPRIIKCNVAPKSTVDGKLNVEIQVTTGK